MDAWTDEGRKRVLAIVAGILVAKHLVESEVAVNYPQIREHRKATEDFTRR